MTCWSQHQKTLETPAPDFPSGFTTIAFPVNGSSRNAAEVLIRSFPSPFSTERVISTPLLSYQPQEAALFSCSLGANPAGTSLQCTLEHAAERKPLNMPSHCQHGEWRRVSASSHKECLLPVISVYTWDKLYRMINLHEIYQNKNWHSKSTNAPTKQYLEIPYYNKYVNSYNNIIIIQKTLIWTAFTLWLESGTLRKVGENNNNAA